MPAGCLWSFWHSCAQVLSSLYSFILLEMSPAGAVYSGFRWKGQHVGLMLQLPRLDVQARCATRF